MSEVTFICLLHVEMVPMEMAPANDWLKFSSFEWKEQDELTDLLRQTCRISETLKAY